MTVIAKTHSYCAIPFFIPLSWAIFFIIFIPNTLCLHLFIHLLFVFPLESKFHESRNLEDFYYCTPRIFTNWMKTGGHHLCLKNLPHPTRSSLVAQLVKSLPVMWETQVQFPGGKIPWRRAWQPTPVFLPGKSHGQRSLAGYSPWGHRVGHNWVTNTFTLHPSILFLSQMSRCPFSSFIKPDISCGLPPQINFLIEQMYLLLGLFTKHT